MLVGKLNMNSLKWNLIFIIIFMQISNCDKDESSSQEKTSLELAQDYCSVFCQNVSVTCPDIASEMPADTNSCVSTCVQGDEPEGQHQSLAFLECIATIQNCEDFTTCKSEN